MYFHLQTEEALRKAKEKLEFCRDVMMIPRNLAGKKIKNNILKHTMAAGAHHCGF